MSTFFDVNGRIGFPSNGDVEFPDAQHLLKHLDALGVSRSLVWHVSARDVDPTFGNQVLENELETLARDQDRLFPALVVSPSMLFEERGLDHLRHQVRSLDVRAFRLFPRSLKYSLKQIHSLVRSLFEFQPSFFVDCRNLESIDALVEFAQAFPGLSVVYTNATWAQFGDLIYLLESCPNAAADTSWLHGCGMVEGIVRQFGPERLIFGLGHKFNHGAGILDLLDARISPAARDMIAHGNLERVLRLAPIDPSLPPLPNKKGGLWNTVCQGQPSPEKIIDAHGHLGPFGTWRLPKQQLEDQISDMLTRMDRLGIETMILSATEALLGDPVAGNRRVEAATVNYRSRFQGYLVFNPHYDQELTPTFDEFFSRDFFVGFKLLSSYWRVPVTDLRHAPVWEYANTHRLPILLHTWDDPYDLPMLLDNIVANHPDAFFILGHSGGTDPGRASALELALKHNNVYLEWCGSFQMTRPYEELISAVGADRILFGTDAALHSPAWELGRFLSLDLSDATLQPALGANMRRILGSRRPKNTIKGHSS